jgi:hypothetical protein
MPFDNPIEVLSLAISVISLLVTICLALLAFQIAEKAARNDFVFQIREWGDQFVAFTGEAIAELQSPTVSNLDLMRLVARASAIADAGRFHYPNSNNQAYGGNQVGFRHHATDLVMLLHGLLRGRLLIPPPAGAATYVDAVVCIRRAFVDLTFRCTNFRNFSL